MGQDRDIYLIKKNLLETDKALCIEEIIQSMPEISENEYCRELFIRYYIDKLIKDGSLVGNSSEGYRLSEKEGFLIENEAALEGNYVYRILTGKDELLGTKKGSSRNEKSES